MASYAAPSSTHENCESCATNPWVPLGETPVYGVRPEEVRSLPSQYSAPAEAPAASNVEVAAPTDYAAPVPNYDSPVDSSVAISQASLPAAEQSVEVAPTAPTYFEEAVQQSIPEAVVQDQSLDIVQQQQQQFVQEPAQAYFIPAEPVAIPPVEVPAQEETVLLSQPETTVAPFIPLPSFEPVPTGAPETYVYSSFVPAEVQEEVAPVQVPEIAEQDFSVAVTDAPAPVEEAPQQVAVFFSAPAQQVVSAPTQEYLPPIPVRDNVA